MHQLLSWTTRHSKTHLVAILFVLAGMLSEENLLVKMGLSGSPKGVTGSDLVATVPGREEEGALKTGCCDSFSASSARLLAPMARLDRVEMAVLCCPAASLTEAVLPVLDVA